MKTLIIKPTHNCNLKCVYCYDQIQKMDTARLSIEDTALFLKQVREIDDEIEIVWHGGEPLIMSIKDYYEPIYKEILPQLNFRKITSSMQTNLTLLTKEIIDFCNKYKIHIGTSFDGVNNDLTRHNTKKFFEKWELFLENSETSSGALMTVDWNNCDTLIESWKYAKNNNLSMGFNEYFGSDLTFENQQKIIDSFKKFGDYLIEEEKIPLNELPRPFSLFANSILGINSGVCETSSCQYKWLSLAPNGDIYPCGRNWLTKDNKFVFGNIHNESLEDILNSEKRLQFEEELLNFSLSCNSCKYNNYCNSGCPNTRFLNTGSITKKDSLTCYFVKEMYDYMENIINK